MRASVRRFPADTDGEDAVAVEEPLEIRVEGQGVAVTLRTPGHDLDLAAGFLLTEGIIDALDDLAALQQLDPNRVDTVLAAGVEAHRARIDRAKRELYATSSCGICGKASIDRILVDAPPLKQRLEPDPAVLVELPDRLRAAQPGFLDTGGLHAAALFAPDGTIDSSREDIGRHNAVDKVIGARLRADRVPIEDRILVVTSRAGFEIVQKALLARIPVVAAMGAPSSLAIELATASGIALIGFLRNGRFNRYL